MVTLQSTLHSLSLCAVMNYASDYGKRLTIEVCGLHDLEECFSLVKSGW
jgi:hypothetical protein